jgi:hypothetical protein
MQPRHRRHLGLEPASSMLLTDMVDDARPPGGG